MNKLVLFDIDGTLVKSIPGNPHAQAFIQAIENLHSIQTELNWERAAGLTDRLIFKQLLEAEGWQEAEILEKMPQLINELENVYVSNFEPKSVEKMPGIDQTLARLRDLGIELGLLTGNLEKIAEAKLSDAGIFHYFNGGGFGSDKHTKRSDLVSIAVERFGMKDNLDQVYLIGDTPRDITAALDAGVNNAIGYSASHHGEESLKEAGAKAVIDTFENWKVIADALDI